MEVNKYFFIYQVKKKCWRNKEHASNNDQVRFQN